MSKFWDDFAAGFVPAFNKSYQQSQQHKHEKELLSQKNQEAMRENLLKLAAKRAGSAPKVEDYTNSVLALRARLTDKDDNLLPGSEALLSNPAVAHEVLNQVEDIEQNAADKRINILPLTGQTIIDNFTVYDAGRGRRAIVPQYSVEDITELWSDGELTQDEYEQTYMALSQPIPEEEPEPRVTVNPDLMRRYSPEDLAKSEEYFNSLMLDRLNEDIAGLRDAKEADDPVASKQWVRLTTIRDSYKDDPEGPARTELVDMYGGYAYGVLSSTDSPYIIDEETNPMFARARKLYEQQQDTTKIKRLKDIIDTNGSEEVKRKARELLKKNYGIDY